VRAFSRLAKEGSRCASCAASAEVAPAYRWIYFKPSSDGLILLPQYFCPAACRASFWRAGTTRGTGADRPFATLPDAGAYLRYASLIGAPICFQSGTEKRKGKRRLEAEPDENADHPS
jgi:hypothetical protein